MSEIIDILSPKVSDCPTFTVNTAVDYVAITPVLDVDMYGIGLAAPNKLWFTKGESFSLLSFGYVIPESFALSTMQNVAPSFAVPAIRLTGKYPAGTYFNIPAFGGQSTSAIPMPNFEFTSTAFYNGSATTDKYKLACFFPYANQEARISMLNVPAAFNGKVFTIVPFVKVLHTLLMLDP